MSAPAPPLLRLDEVDSTQRVAKELALEGAAPGTCVVARRQTGGRGRLGRTWVEPAEGLYLSMVLHPACPPAHAPRITLGAAVGVLAALDELAVPALVKWPNDLVIASASPAQGRLGPFRKVGGLLVEVVRLGARLESCVLGVGLNVRAGAWPADLALTAGALADAGFAGTVDDVLAAVRRHLPPAIEESLTAFTRTLAVLRVRSATLGRPVQIDDEGRCVDGTATALLDDGALLVVDGGGAEHVVRAGDVWLRG